MLHEHINENQISSQTKHKTYEIETKSKPWRAQEGRVSFPIQSQYKDSKIHSSNPTLEEKGRKNRRDGERRTGGRGGSAWTGGAREERVGERYLSPLTLELKD